MSSGPISPPKLIPAQALRPTYSMILLGAAALIFTGIVAFAPSTFSAQNLSSHVMTVLTALLLGLFAHHIQSPFRMFSVVLFLGLWYFLNNRVILWTGSAGDVTAAQPAIDRNSKLVFWITLVFSSLFLLFTYAGKMLYPLGILTADDAAMALKM